jgi:hypothetical protein
MQGGSEAEEPRERFRSMALYFLVCNPEGSGL